MNRLQAAKLSKYKEESTDSDTDSEFIIQVMIRIFIKNEFIKASFASRVTQYGSHCKS